MSIALNHLLNFDYFKSLRLIAGEGGLSGEVDSCGILDYEMDRTLNRKYRNANFMPNQLIISSLFFAKEDPFLVNEAVKYLVEKQTRGLVIKNIFRIPIQESVLRYANSKKFPIFLMTDTHMFFEQFIIEVDRCNQILRHTAFLEQELDRLFSHPMERPEKKRVAQMLFPAMRDQYAVACFEADGILFDDLALKPAVDAQIPNAERFHYITFRHRKKLCLYVSWGFEEQPDQLLQAFFEQLRAQYPDGSAGVSRPQFHPEDVDRAIREATYAAAVFRVQSAGPCSPGALFLRYQDIGIYQALLPLFEQEAVCCYSNRILEPLIEFDAETRSVLLKTLLDFVQCGGDLHVLARQTGQHENTIRYRLDKVCALTGLNFRKLADYEALALAARVYLLAQIL